MRGWNDGAVPRTIFILFDKLPFRSNATIKSILHKSKSKHTFARGKSKIPKSETIIFADIRVSGFPCLEDNLNLFGRRRRKRMRPIHRKYWIIHRSVDATVSSSSSSLFFFCALCNTEKMLFESFIFVELNQLCRRKSICTNVRTY